MVKKKWGLQSPIAKWMKGPLQPFLKEILNKDYYANSSKYLNFKNINHLIDLHKEKYYTKKSANKIKPFAQLLTPYFIVHQLSMKKK